MKKIIAMDLDGTLLNDNNACPEKTKEYLQKLKDKGHIIVIATGRILKSAKDITDGAKFTNYIVSDSGSEIYDTKYKDIISENTIKQSDVIKICKEYKSYWGILEICDKKWCNVYTNQKYEPREYDKLITNLEEFLNSNQKITHISIIPKQNCVYQIIDKLENELNKFNGIKLIADKENIENKDIICFGDGLNDIEMIEKSGMGVAMGNALSDIKQIADFTTLSNNEEGIKYFLQQNVENL